MLSIRDQILFVRNLAALLRAGLGLDISLIRLQRMMPKHADLLKEMAAGINKGKRLSQVTGELLPEEVLAVIVAGEQSGGLVNVLEEIRNTLLTKLKIRKAIGQLYRPLGLFFFGISVFVGFALFVIPSMVEATQKMGNGNAREPNALLGMMTWVSVTITSYWPIILGVIGAAVTAVVVLTRDPKMKAQLYGMVLKTPVLGAALNNIHFSLWARYLAMMVRAGYDDMPKALAITERTLPGALQSGMNLFRQDILIGRGLGVASDENRLPEGDPRRSWPAHLLVALLISEKTGETDSQLQQAAEYMLEDAEAAINKVLDGAKLIVLVMIAMSAGLPIMSYLLEMVTMMTTALKNI
ncbi:type II secretion system F family protein [Geopseudomonas aromaticivorans]